jgi:Transcriptional regulator
MEPINFSLAQIEAFACVCESGTLTQAAKKLKKDRTTVSQLIDYLEIDLGYVLFDRNKRPLELTDSGKRLYRQARLFLHEAQAFSQVAKQLPEQLKTQLIVCYDPFTPRDFLICLTNCLARQQISLDLLMCEREEAERWLDEGKADIGIYQALNRSVNDHLKWRAVGAISLSVWARKGFFPISPVSMLHLAASPQLVPFCTLQDALAKRIQIADRTIRVNELALLQRRLSAGDGWAFLPRHFGVEEWENVERQETEAGDKGLTHPMVALWKPGQMQPNQLERMLSAIDLTWCEDA